VGVHGGEPPWVAQLADVRRFNCENCSAELFFENSICVSCGSPVGYARDLRRLVVVGERPICADLDRCGCNWIADLESPAGLCFNCTLTRTRPADGDLAGLGQYAVAESAKRRLIFELDDLGLPIKPSDGYVGLAFDLLSSSRGKITTGYENGVITLDLAESDDAHREALRASMEEPYRTVLGHFRHEIGHYYCELLALTPDNRDEFRRLFGDETISYADALERHYAEGQGAEWQNTYISSYAAMHPLEDFAEVFAHFLHISDALQTAAEFGLLPGDASRGTGFAEVVTNTWLPLTRGLNQINRSMGKDDLYPFVLAEPVLAKLSYVADLVQTAGSQASATAAASSSGSA
jgi:hypothetical protein